MFTHCRGITSLYLEKVKSNTSSASDLVSVLGQLGGEKLAGLNALRGSILAADSWVIPPVNEIFEQNPSKACQKSDI
jgi:hypothetical protein